MSGLAQSLIDGLVGGTILFALTLLATSIPAVRARPALVCAMWLVVLARFIFPLAPGGAYTIDGLFAALAGDRSFLFPSLGGQVGPAGAAAASQPSGVLFLFALWALVSLVLATRTIIAAARTRLGTSVMESASGEVLARLRFLAAQIGVRRLPRLVVGGIAPMTVGLLRQTIVIPKWLEGEGELDHVLAHELAHVARRDILWAALARAAQVVLFFWPPVWMASRWFAAAREAACDRLAVRATGCGGRAFAKSLVAVSVRLLAGQERGLAMAARPSELGARVKSLLAGNGRAGLGLVGCLLLGFQVMVAVPSAPRAADDGEGRDDCVVAPGTREALLAEHPEADRDGDGILSRVEICAHQQRSREGAPTPTALEADLLMCVEEFMCREGAASSDVPE